MVEELGRALLDGETSERATAVASVIPDAQRTYTTSDGGVTTGYSIVYSSGASSAILTDSPVSDGVELAGTSLEAARSFLRVVEGVEFVTVPAFADTQPRRMWISNGHLISLAAPADQLDGLAGAVLPAKENPVVDTRRAIDEILATSNLVARAAVTERWLLEKRAGAPGSLGAACLTADGERACAEFGAVGSIASIVINARWYLVGIVPTKPPTTYFRTEPTLSAETVDADEWTWTILEVPSGTREVTVYYTTEGVSQEFATIFARP